MCKTDSGGKFCLVGVNINSAQIYMTYHMLLSPIWHTSWNNNTFYIKKKFIDRDIKYIKHLLNKEGKLYNYNGFINKTAIQINFLDYHSLLKKWILSTLYNGFSTKHRGIWLCQSYLVFMCISKCLQVLRDLMYS